MECQLPFRPRVDQFAQLIAVTRTRVEEREDEQLGRSALQFPIEGARVETCHEQIVCGQVVRVNGAPRGGFGRMLIGQLGTIDRVALVTLKGHLVIEEALMAIIDTFVFHPEELDATNLTSHAKVALARSLFLDENKNSMWELLLALNTLRNEMAHAIDSPKRAHRTNRVKALYRKEQPGPELTRSPPPSLPSPPSSIQRRRTSTTCSDGTRSPSRGSRSSAAGPSTIRITDRAEPTPTRTPGPGLLSGGPSRYGGDPVIDAMPATPPAATATIRARTRRTRSPSTGTRRSSSCWPASSPTPPAEAGALGREAGRCAQRLVGRRRGIAGDNQRMNPKMGPSKAQGILP